MSPLPNYWARFPRARRGPCCWIVNKHRHTSRYKLLRIIQRHAKGTLNVTHVAPAARVVVPWITELAFEYVLYDEADNTFHFEGTALRDIFEVLTQHPDYGLAPPAPRGRSVAARGPFFGNLTKSVRTHVARRSCRGWCITTVDCVK